MIKAVRGTRDLLPPETALWNFVESAVRDVFRAHNFQEIRTPIFESTELFARGVGEETDIVSKEMFTWNDRSRTESDELPQPLEYGEGLPPGETFERIKQAASAMEEESRRRAQSLTLRPENTAGVVRAYIEHDLEKRGLNKLYYIGPQFRRERPQKGRYRQFYQIGAEVIGPSSSGSERPLRDAEILEMLDTLLRRLGISDFTLHVNSVGDAKDRAEYNDALRRALQPIVAKMCSDCQRRAVTNPLRVFDCKVPGDQPIIQTLPVISSYLGTESKEHFENVQALLRQAGVAFEINPRLVRGLDYYTRTAFEFTHGALGAQNAIIGGGRYDGLAEMLGSPHPAPGIGFAIGEDRLIMALQARMPETSRHLDAYIAPVGEGMNRESLLLARDLRRTGLAVELGDRSFRLKKMFETATKIGAKYILIVGENEVKADAFSLKNLATGEQVAVPRAELAQRIRG
jgi:histidyl-tRNA synthetase